MREPLDPVGRVLERVFRPVLSLVRGGRLPPLPAALEQSILERCGVKIHNFYGSSECGGIGYDGSEIPRVDAACAGEPVRNVNVTIADDGCVEVRGAAVGQTYWPESSPNLREGVFRTTDFGEIKDGLLYLRGRATDQINVAGRKVRRERGHEGMRHARSGTMGEHVAGARLSRDLQQA